MRTSVIAAVFAGSALFLTACSGEPKDAQAGTESTATPAATDMTAATPAVATVADANTATEQQLAGLAGVTPEIAAAIVAGRPYDDANAFAVALEKTTSKEAAAELMTRVFVPVNLNTASEDAIERIPGMTPKMVHEFLEYRPYADMAEFDREIGKYVDAAEVARFRTYVTL
jgi:DNA uptake protein ComE-like DNA-binding protein